MCKNGFQDRETAHRSSKNSLDLLASDDALNPPKKRRNKPIKSCKFCRQKKLRCDQKRPRCSTCIQKGIACCIYSNSATAKETPLSDSNEELKDRVSKLEQKLSQIEDKKEADVPPSRNVLLQLNFFHIKQSGRHSMFGPTSTRTFFLNERWGFCEKYFELRKRMRSEQKKSKGKGQSDLFQNEPTELRDDMNSESKKDYTLFSEVLGALPSFESILRKIDYFFEDSELFVINEVFDKTKVIKDFQECFMPGPESLYGNNRPIKNFLAPSKNCYKIGVILGILMYMQLSDKPPSSFETFFVMLHGMGLGKMNCIERIQVTFLRYSFRAKWGFTGCDALSTIALVNCMVNDALIVGLNTNINLTFEKYQTICGNTVALRKLWLWILFYDVDSALQMGSFLKVPDEVIFDQTVFEIGRDSVGSPKNLMGAFLHMSRPMLLSVYHKEVMPNLESYCEDIIQFIEEIFPVEGSYTEEAFIKSLTFRKMIVLSAAFSLLLAFYGLRLLTSTKTSNGLKSALGKATVVAFSLSVSLIMKYFKRDKLLFSTTLENNFKCLSPYLCLTISVLSRLIVRALSIFYTIFYHKLTVFRSGLCTLQLKDQILRSNITSLRVSSAEEFSLMTAFKNLSEIFDQFKGANDEVFNLIVHRSTTLLKAFALEGMCRQFMDRILKSNKVIEKAGMVHYLSDINSASANSMTTTGANSPPYTGPHQLLQRMGECDPMPLFSEGANAGSNYTIIDQEFSSACDLDWEILLGTMDDVDLYYELMENQ